MVCKCKTSKRCCTHKKRENKRFFVEFDFSGKYKRGGKPDERHGGEEYSDFKRRIPDTYKRFWGKNDKNGSGPKVKKIK